MTINRDGSSGGDDDPPANGAYEVGYGKPPAEHRFKKGKSGNPRGRPPNRKALEFPNAVAIGAERAKECLFQEAFRPVTIREGDQKFELPVFQALCRGLGVSGLKGNGPALRTFVGLILSAEAEELKRHLEHIDAVMAYKFDGAARIEEARAHGRPEPELIPHPDDIIFDFATGRVTVCGPMTKEQKAEWDERLTFREEVQTHVSRFSAEYRTARDPKERALALETWMSIQKRYDEINDNLPKRYRKELQDRCSLEGPSRPGRSEP